jgi:RsiW-degrading membrane proteinase PrsW (M82 family)
MALLAGFLLAALLHGFYDFLVLLNPVGALPIAATLITAVWVWRLILLQRLQSDALNETCSRYPRS